MAQGFIRSNSRADMALYIGDSPSVDAFSRLRVSQPTRLFDGAFTYGLAPLRFEQITNGSGATITHDTTNRCALMGFNSTPTGGKAYMQTYRYLVYQPGKSQQAFITFNFNDPTADVLKFAGLSDGVNGIEFQQSGSTKQFKLYSGTGVGTQTVTQSNWNLDTFDGNGASAINLDTTKIQILVIDLQALFSGRVRVGFDVGGGIYYVHEFKHANLVTTPYIQTATLPIRCGMTCTGTVTSDMRFICSNVNSEGGALSYGGRDFAQNGNVSAGSGTRTHLLSVRPKTTFNSITNRIEFELTALSLLVTGNQSVYWELCLGQAISGTTTFNDVNTTYSGMEYNTAGTISGSPSIVIDSGYIGSSGNVKGAVNQDAHFHYPITLDAAGAVRALGTVSLVVTGVGGASQTYGVLNWTEIR